MTHFQFSWCKKSSARNNERGVSLVELLIAVGIFSVVVMIAVGSVLSIIDANQKSRTKKVILNNLNSTLDTMTRTIRDGDTYNCGGTGQAENPCPSGSTIFAFERNGGDPANASDQTVYRLNSVTKRIERSLNSGASDSWYPITSEDVEIEVLEFQYRTSGGELPRVDIVIQGKTTEGDERIDSSFELQTTVAKRYDFDTTLTFDAVRELDDCEVDGVCEWGESVAGCSADCERDFPIPGMATNGNGICEWGEDETTEAACAGSPSATPGSCQIEKNSVDFFSTNVFCPFQGGTSVMVEQFEFGRASDNFIAYAPGYESREYTVSIPGGTYDIWLAGNDDHVGDPCHDVNQAEYTKDTGKDCYDDPSAVPASYYQLYEQYKIRIGSWDSSYTPDIPHTQNLSYAKVGSGVTIGPTTKIEAIANTSSPRDSVVPACIAFVEVDSTGTQVCTPSGTTPGSPTDCTACDGSLGADGGPACPSSCSEPAGSVETYQLNCTGCFEGTAPCGEINGRTPPPNFTCYQPTATEVITDGAPADVGEF